MNSDEDVGGEDDYNLSVVWRTGKTGALRQGIFILAPGGGGAYTHACARVMVNCSIATWTQ